MAFPEEVIDLATACIASVNATVGVELDFTPDTLPLLDHYAKTQVEPGKEEIVLLTAQLAGAYFGEVVRRRFEGARWHTPKEDQGSWRLEFDGIFLFFNPVGIALDVILEGDGPYDSHLQTRLAEKPILEHALQVYGDVRESDYYTFAVRLEAIEQAAMALGRNQEDKSASFGSADYRQYIEAQAKN